MPISENAKTRDDLQQLTDAIAALPDDAYGRLRGIVEGMEIAYELINTPTVS